MSAPKPISITFRGEEVTVLQEFREKKDNEDNTGFCVWECSNICLRYLAKDENLAKILAQAEGVKDGGVVSFRDLRLLDLSAGAGLLAIAFAKAGAANVAATDIPAQLPQLEDNIHRAGLEVRRKEGAKGKWKGGDAGGGGGYGAGGVTVAPLYWGEPLDALKSALMPPSPSPIDAAAAPLPPPIDIAVASDILFIALRDKRTEELACTLKHLLTDRVAKALLFGFEERLWREEDEWMRVVVGLGFEEKEGKDGEEKDDRALFTVTELKGDDVTLAFEDSLASKGAGDAGSEIFNPFLFWECPPVRVFVITLKEQR